MSGWWALGVADSGAALWALTAAALVAVARLWRTARNIIVFQLGRLSRTWLAVRRPLRWLAVISVIPALVSLATHPVAIAFSEKYGSIPPRSLAEMAPRMVAGTVLIFCALALGYLIGRESPRRAGSAASRGGGTNPAEGDDGQVATPDRATP